MNAAAEPLMSTFIVNAVRIELKIGRASCRERV